MLPYFLIQDLTRKALHVQNSSAQKNLIGIKNIDFGCSSHRHAVDQFDQSVLLPMPQKHFIDRCLRVAFFLDSRQRFSSCHRFQAAEITTTAAFCAAKYRNMTQFAGGSVPAAQRCSVQQNRVSDACTVIDAADQTVGG